ncbi:SDR family NAD(P)-dependent oxidoreductase [Seohaeicola zhoushanensis]|uniref:3-hydroxyacyl-CoA dehydrogenase n=1 Tax=Seohaeicola zhoushanensis TaxID=1569283 RepID=A0A8J3GVJ5_9RHOB|nr:SDR family NAD(P)-dependent oxidoreductase [Seohaeicola zhoushanensis]GHF39639.1 3-hydroxyacyl-CoA dehydrogenase [Seohaeicola zhoushanensis]
MDPKGQIAIVTGSGSGLGRAVAQALTRRGARVVGIDLPPRDGAAELLELALSLHGDVADAAQMEPAFARVDQELGCPTILVNCAGILGPARVFQIDRETGEVSPRAMDRLRRVIDVNLTGTFNTIRLFAAGLARGNPQVALDGADRGVIVNTASVAAYEALSAQAAYGSSKAGVAAMTLPLARELARYGIRIVALAPGTFETGMVGDIPDHTRRRLVEDVPFPNRMGRGDEFAHLALACIENQMLNGSVLRIDGAVRMREPREALA